MSRQKERPDPCPQGVLTYLERMEYLCKQLHRSDLQGEYREAWEDAALNIYGQLPPRKEVVSVYESAGACAPKVKTHEQKEMLARPWRRIVALDGDDEILECGHRHWHVPAVTGVPEAKRRRCRDCPHQAAAEKKSVESAAPRRKEVSA